MGDLSINTEYFKTAKLKTQDVRHGFLVFSLFYQVGGYDE
jgi:hypothetical protein